MVTRVAVTNAVLSNTGDAAIYQSIVESISDKLRTDLDVIVFDSDARTSQKLYPEWRIFQQLAVSPPRRVARVRNVLQKLRHKFVSRLATPSSFDKILALPLIRKLDFARSYAALRSVDIVVSSGGTYLVDHYNFLARVLELEVADRLHKPVVLWTQSLGPFDSDRAIRQIRRIAPVTNAVYFRDARSAEAWDERTDVAVRSRTVPDSVFALEAPDHSVVRAQRKRALISVRKWSRGVDSASFSSSGYEDGMREAVALLSDAGYACDALSTCQGVPSYSYDDSEEAGRIFTGLPVVINRDFHTPTQLLAELSSTSVVVTTRMHLAILALISRVPVIAVAYEFKTLELFNALGLGKFVLRIEDMSSESMGAVVSELLSRPDDAVLSEAMLQKLRHDARLPADDLSSLLKEL